MAASRAAQYQARVLIPPKHSQRKCKNRCFAIDTWAIRQTTRRMPSETLEYGGCLGYFLGRGARSLPWCFVPPPDRSTPSYTCMYTWKCLEGIHTMSHPVSFRSQTPISHASPVLCLSPTCGQYGWMLRACCMRRPETSCHSSIYCARSLRRNQISGTDGLCACKHANLRCRRLDIDNPINQ